MQKRLMISAVLYPIVQSVLFGAPLVLVASLMGPGGLWLLPYLALMSLTMAAPIAWELAPRLSLELSGDDRLTRFREGRR